MAPDRQHAHHLIDQLGQEQLAAVVHLLETIVPMEEGDTLSCAERQAIAEADEWLLSHAPIPHDDVLAEFGLTADDWERMGREPLTSENPRRDG